MKSLQQQFKDKALQSRMTNSSAPRPYDSALVAAVSVKNIVPGLGWKTYNGSFPGYRMSQSLLLMQRVFPIVRKSAF